MSKVHPSSRRYSRQLGLLSLRISFLISLLLLLTSSGCQNQNSAPPARQQTQTDPLPSWNDTNPKKNIIAFVERVTKEGGPDFVPVADRIATFDNDGTLWLEYPMYTQIVFALDRVKQLAPQHPEWKNNAALQRRPRRRHEGRNGHRRKGSASDRRCNQHRHDQRTSTRRWSPTGSPRPATERFNHHLHRTHLSTHGRTSRLPPRQRLQDLHRLRRRDRLHAPLDRKGLRHSARSGSRHHHEDAV